MTENPVTGVVWRSDDSSVANVSAAGLVTAVSQGISTIYASYQEREATLGVFVVPISSMAKQYVVDFNQRYNNYRNGFRGEGIKKWSKSPIAIWADGGFRRRDLEQATSFWETMLPGLVRFAITEDRAGADIVFTFDPTINDVPGRCGEEGPDTVTAFVITSGSGRYATRSECSPNGEWTIGLAHGIGHILGFGGHTPSNSDVMGSPGSRFATSRDLADAMTWIYRVIPATLMVE